jgi:hypothetical protein
MAFREVAVTEFLEVLRAWLAGAGLRKVAEQTGVDRKTARRYVEAAVAAGLARDGGAGQLSDELVGQVAQVVRPALVISTAAIPPPSERSTSRSCFPCSPPPLRSIARVCPTVPSRRCRTHRSSSFRCSSSGSVIGTRWLMAEA